MPDLMGTLSTVLERAEADPIEVEVDGQRVGISAFDIRRGVFHRMYTVRDGIATIPAFVARLANGDYESLARELMKEREEEGVWSMMAMVMDAASGASDARWARIAQERDQALLGDVMNFPTDSIGDAIGAPDLGASYRGVFESDVPVLFIVGDLDAMTPVSNARELMEHLPNAKLVVVEHVAHNDLPLGMPQLFPVWTGFIAGRAVESKTISAPVPSFEPIAKPDADRGKPDEDEASAAGFDVSALIGRYDLGRTGTLEIRKGSSGVLEASIGDEAPQRVRAVSEHELEWVDSDRRLELRLERDGTVKRAFYFEGSRRVIAQKL
ncbi:MAG: alpha/beta hydrolase [Phycisphaerales bacterium]